MMNIDVNVINFGELITLGTRQKQEITVSNATGLATVQLWENNIGILDEGESYKLKSFRAVEYENVKYNAICWSGSEIQSFEPVKIAVDGNVNVCVAEETVSSYAIQILLQCSN